MYCFTTSISHGVAKYFPRLWGTAISEAIFIFLNKIKYTSSFPFSLYILEMISQKYFLTQVGQAKTRIEVLAKAVQELAVTCLDNPEELTIKHTIHVMKVGLQNLSVVLCVCNCN